MRFYKAEGPDVADAAGHRDPALESIGSDRLNVFGGVQRHIGDIPHNHFLHLPNQFSSFLKIQCIGGGIGDFVEIRVFIPAHVPAPDRVIGRVKKVPDIIRIQ